MIYLDHNATTPIAPEVLEAIMPYLTTEWGNPSSSYKFGAKLKGVIETARAQVAELIGANGREIIFTSCATESNNAAVHAALKANPGKRHMVTAAVEHSSVLNYCRALECDRGLHGPHGFATKRREETQEVGRVTPCAPFEQLAQPSGAQRSDAPCRVTYLSVDRDGLLLLDQEGICASSGSACLADSDEPSHVVKAMKPESAASRQMIRFSLGLENTTVEVNAALSAIARAVKRLRS